MVQLDMHARLHACSNHTFKIRANRKLRIAPARITMYKKLALAYIM